MKLDQHLLTEFQKFKVATPTTAGTYGGGLDCMAILSHLLSYEIMVLDNSQKDKIIKYKCGKKGHIHIYQASTALTYLKHAHIIDADVIVIEFNGHHGIESGGHFAAYYNMNKPTSHELPMWLHKVVQLYRNKKK